MKAAVEPLEGNKVKLSIEVEEHEFEKDIDAAFRKIAREVRIPGFRPGKAPRRILEARLGKETGRSEALRDALPGYYSRAVRDHDVDVVAPPEIDIKDGQDAGGVSFDAVVEVRPQIQVPGYKGLQVTIPSPLVADSEVDAQVDRLRSNFATLETVERPAANGDHVTIDLHGSQDGEPISGLSTDDFVYEVGSGAVLPELDEHLAGAKVGDILAFDADVPGTGPAKFRVLVKEVKEKSLPEPTDDWVSEASEFETLAELRQDISKRIGEFKRLQAMMTLRNATVDALVELVAEDPPDSMVQAEVERRIHDLGHRLEAQRATIEDYLSATGQSGEELVSSLRQQAVPAVKADLALRAVADAEGIDPAESDLDEEIARLAAAYGMKPAQARRNLEQSDQMRTLRADWRKSRALQWLVDNVEVVDTEGQPVDRSLLEPEAGSEKDAEVSPEAAEATGETDSHAEPEEIGAQ